MLLHQALGVVLAAIAMNAIAAPMGSKHNLYLATCSKQTIIPDCPLIILCPRQRAATYTAVAYYANGPIESNRNKNPTQIATVSNPAAPWEGTQRVAKLGRAGDFASNIDAGARNLAKSAIAGEAKLGTEEFVCFKDGESAFTVRDELDIPEYSCKADYWCASIQV
ncbi:uncharacterized protein EI97DRAFT_436784 [Westerdykella ornata]|uniref:Uncharacterized protein n=1 Tax=Westerdykella ornata TaxID=318751 RepID=A0A6A6J7M0_WESOR|nr:uncharacterized protein EI97DRAFT_436784 [Westerdykella ornata]KAF2272541.1 hypothetical protein EI97DRAFT_436784 [Westerdykella ornata]